MRQPIVDGAIFVILSQHVVDGAMWFSHYASGSNWNYRNICILV